MRVLLGMFLTLTSLSGFAQTKSETSIDERVILFTRNSDLSYYIPNQFGYISAGTVLLLSDEVNGKKNIRRFCFTYGSAQVLKYRLGSGGFFSTFANSFGSIGARQAEDIRRSRAAIRRALNNDSESDLIESFDNASKDITGLEFSENPETEAAYQKLYQALKVACS
jgi:hypothetical protein